MQKLLIKIALSSSPAVLLAGCGGEQTKTPPNSVNKQGNAGATPSGSNHQQNNRQDQFPKNLGSGNNKESGAPGKNNQLEENNQLRQGNDLKKNQLEKDLQLDLQKKKQTSQGHLHPGHNTNQNLNDFVQQFSEKENHKIEQDRISQKEQNEQNILRQKERKAWMDCKDNARKQLEDLRRDWIYLLSKAQKDWINSLKVQVDRNVDSEEIDKILEGLSEKKIAGIKDIPEQFKKKAEALTGVSDGDRNAAVKELQKYIDTNLDEKHLEVELHNLRKQLNDLLSKHNTASKLAKLKKDVDDQNAEKIKKETAVVDAMKKIESLGAKAHWGSVGSSAELRAKYPQAAETNKPLDEALTHYAKCEEELVEQQNKLLEAGKALQEFENELKIQKK